MNKLVENLVRRSGDLSIDEAADIYRAYAARLLIDGTGANQQTLRDAHRAAARTRRLDAYEEARRAAATAWRGALPEMQGPWLMVGAAIANAAGALVLEDVLDKKTFNSLSGPWRQAIGTLVPVGPGMGSNTQSPALPYARAGTDGAIR